MRYLAVDGHPGAATDPWWSGQRWRSDEDGGVVRVSDRRSPARCAFAFAVAPDEGALTVPAHSPAAGAGRARPDRHGSAPCSAPRHRPLRRYPASTTLAEDFDAQLDTVADRWRETWAAAFTRNAEFSGSPADAGTLDDGLARTYYLGALLAVYLRNTGVSRLGPVFLTGGPRLGPTTTLYWTSPRLRCGRR